MPSTSMSTSAWTVSQTKLPRGRENHDRLLGSIPGRSATGTRGSAPWACLVVALFGFVLPLISVPSHHLIAGGDSAIPELNPAGAWRHALGAWAGASGLGYDNALSRPLLFPFVAGDLFMRKLGASPYLMNRLWLGLIGAIQSAAPVALVRQLLTPSRMPAAVQITVGIVSIMNPYVVIEWHSPFPTTNLSVAMFPLLAATGASLVSSPTPLRYLLYVILCYAAAAGDFNPGIFAVEVGFGALLLALSGLSAIAAKCAVAAGYLGANLAYVLPLIRPNFVTQVAAQWRNYSIDTLRVTSLYSAWPHSLRLIGEYLFFNNSAGASYLPQGHAYDSNILLVLATWCIPAMALAGLIWAVHRGERNVMCAGVVAAVALFLAKGTAPPLGWLYDWAFRNWTLVDAFRDSFAKFEWVAVVCYAILIGYFLLCVVERRAHKVARLAIAAAVVASAISAFPMLEGHLFWQHSIIRVPRRYTYVANEVNAKWRGVTIASLPAARGFFESYSWGYIGAGVLSQLLNGPLLSGEFRLLSPANEKLLDALEVYPDVIGSRALPSLLGLYSIGGVISDSSLDQGIFYGGGNTPMISPSAAPGGLHLAVADGGLDVYSVSAADANPPLYVARKLFVGVATLPEEATVCRLYGCLGAAFVSRDAVRAGELNAASVSFGYGGFYPRESQRTFARPPAFSAVPPLPRTRSQTYADYANGVEDLTNSVRLARRYVGYGTRPIVIRISTARSLASTDYYNLATDWLRPDAPLALPMLICVSANQYLTRTFVPRSGALSGSEEGLIAATLRSAPELSTSLAYQTSDGRDYLWFVASDGDLHDMLRLAPLSERSWIRITVGGGTHGGCAEVRYVALAEPLSASAGRRALDFPTSPYMAATSALFPSGYTDAYRAAAATGAIPASPTALSALQGWSNGSATWQGPDVDSPSGASPDQVVEVSSAGDLTRVAAMRAAVDVYASLSRVYAGVACTVTVRARSDVPSDIQLAVVDNGHAPIIASNFSVTRHPEALELNFVPTADAEPTLYAYINSSLRAKAVVLLGRPTLNCDLPPTTVSVRGSPLQGHVPTTSVHLVDGRWHIRVTGDLRPFVVVLNQSYDPGWEMTADDAAVQVEHLTANAGVNAWLVMGPGTYTLSVYYDRQRTYASAWTAAVLLVLLGAFLTFTALWARTRGARPGGGSRSAGED